MQHLVNNRYRVVWTLAGDGMIKVYLARDDILGRGYRSQGIEQSLFGRIRSLSGDSGERPGMPPRFLIRISSLSLTRA